MLVIFSTILGAFAVVYTITAKDIMTVEREIGDYNENGVELKIENVKEDSATFMIDGSYVELNEGQTQTIKKQQVGPFSSEGSFKLLNVENEKVNLKLTVDKKVDYLKMILYATILSMQYSCSN